MKEKIAKIFFSIILILIIVILSNIDVYALENSNEVDTTIWGHEVVLDGHTVYVKDGTDSLQWSVPLKKNICWLISEYEYSKTWYALDNTKGAYPDGSMFWVKIISIDSVEYNYYKEKLDDSTFSNDNNNLIIRIGITKPDGTFIEFNDSNELLKDVNLYVQIGEMWDKERINNYLEEINEKNIEYVNLDKDGIKGTFAKISNTSSDIGTAFGEGNIYIICGITIAFILSCAAIVIIANKKEDENKYKK